MSACSHLFYQPDSILYYDPKADHQEFVQLSISTSDSVLLSAWLFKTKQKSTKGTFIHFHGNAQNMSAHLIFSHWLTSYGYNVLAFDYRGYGASQGIPDQDGLVRDGQAVLKYAMEHPDIKQGPFMILGQSLGGAEHKALKDLRPAISYMSLQ